MLKAPALALVLALWGCTGGSAPPQPATASPAPARSGAPSAASADAKPSSPGPSSPGPGATAPGATAPPPPGATTPPAASAAVVAAQPLPPLSLDEIVAALVAAERAVGDASVHDGDLGALGARQQAAYRALAADERRRQDALARIPEGLRPAVEANLAAGAALRAMVRPVETLPAWHIVAPAPAGELLGYYREAEARFGIPWSALAAIHLVETRMGRIRGTSTAGAQGPMQFLPATWAAYGEGDIEDNRDAIAAAARYLRAKGGAGDLDHALWHYNPDTRYVRAVRAYADRMAAAPRAYGLYHGWEVFVITTHGDVRLPVGYRGGPAGGTGGGAVG